VCGLQLQESQIRVTIIRLALALLGHVVLEDLRGFWVVSIEAVQDGVDVFWPLRREVERDAHFSFSSPSFLPLSSPCLAENR
jgi:hypothetical protein